jgi:hypothetical protein
MTSYPFITQKSGNPKRWQSWTYMQGKQLAYTSAIIPKGLTPTLHFYGLREEDHAGVDQWRDLAEAIQLAANHAANACKLPKKNGGLSMKFASFIQDHDDRSAWYVWDFPVFATKKDKPIIHVKVWTDDTFGGSCVIWCDAFEMGDIPSMAQFKTQANAALQHAELMVKKYTRKNLPQ